jgi:hypothetical protein
VQATWRRSADASPAIRAVIVELAAVVDPAVPT